MSTSPFPFFSRRTPVRPVVPTLPIERGHVLPGDTHADRDLYESANAWSAGAHTVFVRLRVLTPTDAHISVLWFDTDGFGTFLSAPMVGDQVPAEVQAALDPADHVVAVTDTDGPLDVLGVNCATERRDFARVRLFEAEVLGLSRADGDLSADVWARALKGDAVANGWMAASGRADLFALVAMAGTRITLH